MEATGPRSRCCWAFLDVPKFPVRFLGVLSSPLADLTLTLGRPDMRVWYAKCGKMSRFEAVPDFGGWVHGAGLKHVVVHVLDYI